MAIVPVPRRGWPGRGRGGRVGARAVRLALLLVASVVLGARPSSAQLRYEEPEWYLRVERGCRLFVQEYGRGRDTLVVLHGGWGAEHSYLLGAFEGLEDRFHLVFYDQRGSLRSPCPDSLISVDAHVADLERLRAELGLERVTLVGHSMGTRLAMMYLAAYPERVGGLVLLAPASLAPRPPERVDSALAARLGRDLQAFMSRPAVEAELRRAGLGPDSSRWSDEQRTVAWRIRFAGVNLYHVERWRMLEGGQVYYSRAAGEAAARSAPRDYDYTPALAAHRCPVWILQGDHDYGTLAVELQRRWVREVPNVRHVV
ncbi:MAG TPA: alpha/beta hydrolase, partial [Gemmatimonadales bacterium]|nr:alpha/beta hydrolase [Gemmatimonadales bacterium]